MVDQNYGRDIARWGCGTEVTILAPKFIILFEGMSISIMQCGAPTCTVTSAVMRVILRNTVDLNVPSSQRHVNHGTNMHKIDRSVPWGEKVMGEDCVDILLVEANRALKIYVEK